VKVYIAGPMSGIPQFNIPAFDAVANDLRARGYEVVSPAELDDPEIRDEELASPDGDMASLTKKVGEAWGDFLSRDVKLIADEGIEAIVVLPDWYKSRGARLEVTVGTLCGLPIYAYDVEQGKRLLSKDAVDAGKLGQDPASTSGEVRVINSKTGGQKGSKAQRMDLLPWRELMEVAELYAAGAEKYEPHNWRRGFDWSLGFAAMMRHAGLFWEGEDYDQETGKHHLTSVVFHALELLYFAKHYPELDDRPPLPVVQEAEHVLAASAA